METKTTAKCVCDNCGWEGPEDKLGCELINVHRLWDRIDPGGVVPVGECPECGALAYYESEDESKASAKLKEIDHQIQLYYRKTKKDEYTDTGDVWVIFDWISRQCGGRGCA